MIFQSNPSNYSPSSGVVKNSKKLPYKLDVTCDYGNLNDLTMSFNFIVILNEFVYGFNEVSGIDKDIQYESLREGGNPYPVFARKMESDFELLNFKRGMPIRKTQAISKAIRLAFSQVPLTGSSLARRTAMLAAAAMDPIASLENGPALGYLQVFDRQFRTPISTFSFFSYGASKWDITDPNATSAEIMYESITLVCSDLKRMTSNLFTTPPGFWDSFTSTEDRYNIYDRDYTYESLDTNRMAEWESKHTKDDFTEEQKRLQEEQKITSEKMKKNIEEWKNEKQENKQNNKEADSEKPIKEQMSDQKSQLEKEKKEQKDRIDEFLKKQKT